MATGMIPCDQVFIFNNWNVICRIFVDGNFLAIGSHDNCIYIYGVSDNGRKYTRVGKCSVSACIISHGHKCRPLITSVECESGGYKLSETHTVLLAPRVTPASLLTWTGLWTHSSSCQIPETMKSSTVSSTQEYVYSETKTGPPAKHFPYNLGLSFLLCKIEESGWTTSQVTLRLLEFGPSMVPLRTPGKKRPNFTERGWRGGRCKRRVWGQSCHSERDLVGTSPQQADHDVSPSSLAPPPP